MTPDQALRMLEAGARLLFADHEAWLNDDAAGMGALPDALDNGMAMMAKALEALDAQRKVAK